MLAPTTTRPARWVTRGHPGLGGVIANFHTVSWSYCRLCIQFRGLSFNFVYSFVVLLSTFLQFRGLIVNFDYIFVVFGLVIFLDLDSHGAATFTLPGAPSLTEMLLRSSSRVLTWRLWQHVPISNGVTRHTVITMQSPERLRTARFPPFQKVW